ncbi:hypothetical protein [Rhizobium sp. PAMB 3182]
MSLFSGNRLGRAWFIAFFVLLAAFDFAKAPVEKFMVQLQDQESAALMAPTPLSPEQAEHWKAVETSKRFSNGRQPKDMPLMLRAQEDFVRSDGKMSEAEFKARLMEDVATMNTNSPAPPPGLAGHVINRSIYEAIYFWAVIAMTGVTVVGLLYMVTGRVRDIGWTQIVSVFVLALFFAPRHFAPVLPTLVLQATSVAFYLSMIALAVIPTGGNFDFLGGKPQTAPVRQPSIPRKPGQFGRRGTTD